MSSEGPQPMEEMHFEKNDDMKLFGNGGIKKKRPMDLF